MSRQSARIVNIADGVLRDHKDIIGCYDGKWYHHDALYHGAELVWEKLKGGGGEVIASPFWFVERDLYTRNATPVYFGTRKNVSPQMFDDRLQESQNIEWLPYGYNGREYLNKYNYISDDLKNWRQLPSNIVINAFGARYFHNVYIGYQINYTDGTRTFGICNRMYSISGNDISLVYNYFITDYMITEKTRAVKSDEFGCFGDDATLVLIHNEENDVHLCVLMDDMLYHTIFTDKLLNRITRGNPQNYYENIFYGKTAVYLLTNEESTTQRTLYKIGQSGLVQKEYTFNIGTTDFLSPYVYQDRFAVMCAYFSDTLYIYDMGSGTVTFHKFDGYNLDFNYSGGLANICYENGNGLNIVLKDGSGRMALVILDLQGGQDGDL